MNKKKIGIIAILVGSLMGFIFLFVGLIHNSQCEFYCDGWIDWGYIFLLFGLTAVGSGGLFFIFLTGLNSIWEDMIE